VKFCTAFVCQQIRSIVMLHSAFLLFCVEKNILLKMFEETVSA